jgi:hypothetical protein
VEQFKYLETTLTNQSSIHEEIKSRLKSGNACYHSVQNFFFQFKIQECKDHGVNNHNFAFLFIRVWNVVAHNELWTYAKDFREQGAEEDMLT